MVVTYQSHRKLPNGNAPIRERLLLLQIIQTNIITFRARKLSTNTGYLEVQNCLKRYQVSNNLETNEYMIQLSRSHHTGQCKVQLRSLDLVRLSKHQPMDNSNLTDATN